jgi:hypothetical protein
MAFQGRLSVDDYGCVFASPLTSGGADLGLVLPDNYAVRLGPDDDVEIIDPGGSVILREGDGFHASGGMGMVNYPHRVLSDTPRS